MKNVVQERATDPLHGRLAFSVDWVTRKDIADKSVLDVGCGYGWFEYHTLQKGPRRIVGTERTQADLATVVASITDERAEFCTGSALDLPFADATFDTIVSWEVLEHIPKATESQMFAEISRVLRPNGSFYLSTPYDSLFCNLTDPAWLLTGHRHYTYERLRAFAMSNGFEVVEMFATAGWWTILGSLDMYVSKWILRRRPVLAKLTTPREACEFERRDGFVSLFAKFRKIGSADSVTGSGLTGSRDLV